MKTIQLWSVDRTEGKLSVSAVESVDNTKTEQDRGITRRVTRPANGWPDTEGDAIEEFCRQAPRAIRNRSFSYAIELTFGNSDWASLEQPLDKFLAAVVGGWKRASSHPSEMTHRRVSDGRDL